MNPALVMQINFRCVAHLYGWIVVAAIFFVQATGIGCLNGAAFASFYGYGCAIEGKVLA
jgi:hypothetical protein